MEHEPLPTVEDVEKRGPDPANKASNPEEFQEDLRGAVDAAGAAQVMDALDQVARGEAKPEALHWWIDDLRDAERHAQPDSVVDVQEGVVPDFIPDTQRAGGAQEVRDPNAADAESDAEALADQQQAAASEEDADYFFSAVRKRHQESDEPDHGGADDGDGKDAKDAPKPKSKKAAR